MAYLLTKVVIDSVTVKDDSSESDPASLIEWDYEKQLTYGVSSIDLKFLEDVSNLVDIVSGVSITVYGGTTTSTDKIIFNGYISTVEPDGGYVKIKAKDKLWDLVRKNVNNVYLSTGTEAGVISAIAQDLIETYGGLTATVEDTGTVSGNIIDEFRCDNTDIYERLNALAKAVNYQVYYDSENDTVHFESGGYTNSGKTLTVGDEIINVPKWSTDTTRMVNDLRVDGAVVETQIRKPIGSGTAEIGVTTDFNTDGILLDKTPESVELITDDSSPPVTVREGGTIDASTTHYYYIDKQNKMVMPSTGTTFDYTYAIVNYTWLAPAPIHQTNAESIATYGTWEKVMTLSDIQSLADAEARTSEILAKFSTPFTLGEFLIEPDTGIDLDVGNKVIVVDNINNPVVNAEFVITKQIIKWPGSNQELYVGDEAIKLADWQVDVESRLKRIEETLSLQNQDLILELFDMQNQINIEPRYRKVTKRDLNGDGFMLSSPSYAILGTSTLGDDSAIEEDHWIEQYNDTYTENFIDDDFKDSNTTSDWDTSNGELNL